MILKRPCDPSGRLAKVSDVLGGQCTIRTYTFNNASDRTNLTTYNPAVDGSCQQSTPAASATWTYDTAGRTTSVGYVYDTLGRTTTLPALDTQTPTGGDLAGTYHVNDLVHSLTQNGVTVTYALDTDNQRVRQWSDGASIHVNHYSTNSDRPSWIDDGNGISGRSVDGTGSMAAIVVATGGTSSVGWQLTNLHSDVVATVVDSNVGLSATSEGGEYGILRNQTQAASLRYAWLGSLRRAADNPGGVLLMGVRLYNPSTGRFLSVDPVDSGSCGRYEYVCGDPGNSFDPNGRSSVRFHWWGVEERYTRSETRLISLIFFEIPGAFLGGFSGTRAKNFFDTIKKIGLVRALLGLSWSVVFGLTAGMAVWIGITAYWGYQTGRCLRLNHFYFGFLYPSLYNC